MRVSPVYRFPLHSVVTLPPLPLLTTTTTRFLSDIFRGWLSQKTPHSFFTSTVSVLKWTIFCRLLTKDHPAVSESDRCLCNETYSFVCVCVCLWAVCFRLLLQASTDIGYLLERGVPDSVCTCVIVTGEPSAIKRHQNICWTVSTQGRGVGGCMNIQLALVPLSPYNLLTILEQSWRAWGRISFSPRHSPTRLWISGRELQTQDRQRAWKVLQEHGEWNLPRQRCSMFNPH